jgi:iron(III) transport system ATP-binding protein
MTSPASQLVSQTSAGAARDPDEPADVPRVEVRELRTVFRSRGDAVVAVDGVSLTVGAGEMLVLLGPSGCGKTTLLRAIAGLEEPEAGEIEIDGRLVYSSAARIDLPPERRGLSLVFQSYALWPHMTVLDNVTYPLTATGVGRREARERSLEALGLVGCGGLERRYPGELSGGQQQRVALARAVVARSGLIFFDEPLSNIDAKVREKLRLELLNIRDAVGFAGIYVTHDQSEAMILGDRIAVMADGRILQIGTPREIYEQPASRWVADFIGTANFVEGRVTLRKGEHVVVETDIGAVTARPTPAAPPPDEGVAVAVFFRPEWARIADDAVSGENCWECRVEHSIYIGDRQEVVVHVGSRQFVVATNEPRPAGSSAWLHVPAARMQTLP